MSDFTEMVPMEPFYPNACPACGEKIEYCEKHDTNYCSEIDGCGWCDAEAQIKAEIKNGTYKE